MAASGVGYVTRYSRPRMILLSHTGIGEKPSPSGEDFSMLVAEYC